MIEVKEVEEENFKEVQNVRIFNFENLQLNCILQYESI